MIYANKLKQIKMDYGNIFKVGDSFLCLHNQYIYKINEIDETYVYYCRIRNNPYYEGYYKNPIKEFKQYSLEKYEISKQTV